MTNLYRQGRIAEKKVMNLLAEKGFENIRRSSGSRGPADIYAVKDDIKYYVQVKSGSARITSEGLQNLKDLAEQRGGTAVVINKDGQNYKCRFHGRWR